MANKGNGRHNEYPQKTKFSNILFIDNAKRAAFAVASARPYRAVTAALIALVLVLSPKIVTSDAMTQATAAVNIIALDSNTSRVSEGSGHRTGDAKLEGAAVVAKQSDGGGSFAEISATVSANGANVADGANDANGANAADAADGRENGIGFEGSGDTQGDTQGDGIDRSAENSVSPPPNGGKGFVILDAGHGGSAPGSAYGDILEKDIDLKVVLAVAAQLDGMGVDYALTRSEDVYVSLNERVEMSSGVVSPGDVAFFLSVHCDWFFDSSVGGVSTLYSETNPYAQESEALANEIQARITASDYSPKDRGVSPADKLYVLRRAKAPAALLELAFLSNADDRAKLSGDDFVEDAAKRIAEGIEAALSFAE